MFWVELLLEWSRLTRRCLVLVVLLVLMLVLVVLLMLMAVPVRLAVKGAQRNIFLITSSHVGLSLKLGIVTRPSGRGAVFVCASEGKVGGYELEGDASRYTSRYTSRYVRRYTRARKQHGQSLLYRRG